MVTINRIRAFLVEQEITVNADAHALRTSLFAILGNQAGEVSPRLHDIPVILPIVQVAGSTRLDAASWSNSEQHTLIKFGQ